MIGAARARLRTPVIGKRGLRGERRPLPGAGLPPRRHLDRGPSRPRGAPLGIDHTETVSLRAAFYGASGVLPPAAARLARASSGTKMPSTRPAIYSSSIACPGLMLQEC